MSGIAILRRLLMKQAMRKSAGSSGIMTLNKGLAKDVETQVAKWVDSAKRQGADIDKMSEQELKYVIELNKPKAPTTLQELMDKIGLNDPKKNKFLQKEGEVVDMTGKTIKNTENIMGGEEVIIDVVGDTVTNMKAMTPMDAMKEANLVIGRKGKYKNLTIDESQDILKKTNDHIFEREIKYDEFGEIIKPDPEDFAQGGRTGSGLNYLLGEDDQNSRVPYGSGGAGKPPITFTLTGGGSYGKNKIGPGLDLAESGYGFDVGANLDLPWGLSIQGGAGIGRGKAEVDFNDQNVFSGVDETKLGDKWNLGIKGKWPVNFNKMFMKDGGRMGFGLGGMGRRAFLKLMGGAAAGTAAAGTGLLGLLKGGGKKAAIKELTTVPIKAGADGMPLWFKPLVNKVIKEGEDVTKKFSTMDREIVHAAELPGSKTKVLVSQDITTGNVAVDIGYGKHGFAAGHHGQPVRLEYRASEVIEPSFTKNKETIGKAGKTKEEFWVEEAEFTGHDVENVKFEDSTFEKFGSHGSDFTEVEKFATGKTTKKGLKRNELKASYSGPPHPDIPPRDMASGGRVPLGGGGIAGMLGE